MDFYRHSSASEQLSESDLSSPKNWDQIKTVLLPDAAAPIPFHRDVA